MRLKIHSLLLTAFLLAGCEVLPLALPIMISAGGGGVAYTVTNIAYKTVSRPIKQVESALHAALKKMEIKEVKREVTDEGVSVNAATERLEIYIDLEKITPSTTRIKVNAKRSKIFKDKATATEIITQTEKILEESHQSNRPI